MADVETHDGQSEAPSDLRARFSCGVRRAWHGFADLVFPPVCLACQAPLDRHDALCPACWGRMHWIDAPLCPVLGLPFSYDYGPGIISPLAIANPPPFSRMRAVAGHDGVARDLVHRLKYQRRLHLARAMGGWMQRAGAPLLAEADYLVPVPLHRRRLWWRGFNQSVVLARAISVHVGVPLFAHALERTRMTSRQVGLSGKARERNVQGAFRLHEEARPHLAGKRVVLIDDVYTTGATVRAAVRALQKADIGDISVVVFSMALPDYRADLADLVVDPI